MKRIPAVRLACSDLAGEFLYGKSDFRVINNGVSLSCFFFDENLRNKYRKQFSVENKTVFINVGRFVEAKNQSFLIDVFSKYLEQNSNSVLFLAGDGPLLEDVLKKVNASGISENVCFLNHRDDINSLLNMSDVFLLPSLYEGFPLAILEAVATGLPCVVSSSVTKQVSVDGFTQFIPLCVDDWVRAMSVGGFPDRHSGQRVLKDRNSDLDSALSRLTVFFSDSFSGLCNLC